MGVLERQKEILELDIKKLKLKMNNIKLELNNKDINLSDSLKELSRLSEKIAYKIDEIHNMELLTSEREIKCSERNKYQHNGVAKLVDAFDEDLGISAEDCDIDFELSENDEQMMHSLFGDY